MDGQYDSPGYSAELCAVTALEGASKKIVDFAVVHKSETNNVSSRMELEGVKKLIASLKSKHIDFADFTVDKHPSVCAYLRQNNYPFHFDPWHVLRNTGKQIRKSVKEMKSDEDKHALKNLGRRFIVHVYASIESSNDPEICKERVFSFFLHIQGIHAWNEQKFTAAIPVGGNTKVGTVFSKESSFKHVRACLHDDLEGQHQPVDPQSLPYQKLLEITSKTAFINDLSKLKYGNVTSYLESFHSMCTHYRPKKKYYCAKGFERRTMLAAIGFNENRKAEEHGKRTIKEAYEFYSKAKGDMRRKVKMGPVSEDWKSRIVSDAIERKRQYGAGWPQGDADPDDGIAELLSDLLNEALNFDSDDEL